jgi:proteasome beta subunit
MFILSLILISFRNRIGAFTLDSIKTKSNINMNFIEITPNETGQFDAKITKKLTHLKTGTTTTACKVQDGVVLACDNRATMGFFIASKTALKVHRIQDYMYLTIAGGVADAQYIVDLLRAETNLYNMQNISQIGVIQTAKLLQNILFNDKGKYEVGHILAGYTEREGSQVFDIEGDGSMLPEDFVSIGSGSRFALGILETEWKADLSVEEGMSLCAKAVRTALIRDIGSGNGIDVVGISKGQPTMTRRYNLSDENLINNNFSN